MCTARQKFWILSSSMLAHELGYFHMIFLKMIMHLNFFGVGSCMDELHICQVSKNFKLHKCIFKLLSMFPPW